MHLLKNAFNTPSLLLNISLDNELQVKFYLGPTRNAAQETAFQIVLRNCSEEVRGGARTFVLRQRAGSWEHQKIFVN